MELIDLSRESSDAGRFDSFLNSLCQTLEFDYASYATADPLTGRVQGFANYRNDWKAYYMGRNLHRIDPTLHTSAMSIAPVDWGVFDRNDEFSAVFANAPDFDITPQGLTVPVRGPHGDCGLLSVTRKCSREEWFKLKRKVIGSLQMAAVHMHDNVMSSEILGGDRPAAALSAREREILQWCAAGKSQQDIADILTISHRTVEVHLRSARVKLNALTTPQAVGRGISLGLIYPA